MSRKANDQPLPELPPSAYTESGAAPGEAELEEVRLLKPHDHAGQPYDADAVISVTPATAQWLREQGVIE